jgi:hypothetical protein
LSVFAAQGPIALLLDDLQWAEVSALRLLSLWSTARRCLAC